MCIRHRPGAGLSAAYAEEVQVVDIVEGNGEKIRRSSLALLHYVGECDCVKTVSYFPYLLHIPGLNCNRTVLV